MDFITAKLSAIKESAKSVMSISLRAASVIKLKELLSAELGDLFVRKYAARNLIVVTINVKKFAMKALVFPAKKYLLE